jgi:hypothetical protein
MQMQQTGCVKTNRTFFLMWSKKLLPQNTNDVAKIGLFKKNLDLFFQIRPDFRLKNNLLVVVKDEWRNDILKS